MPQNIEEVFTANGLSLFPLHWLISAANAPDKANPVSISVIYYQGDRFSEDPFVLFQLHVKTKSSPPYANCGLLALKPLTLKHPTRKDTQTQYPLKLTLSGNTTSR